ncbi:hypothetical protein FOIG_02936 [Fusarium odoratissimum NRRL 54006]|uniref:Uncharacterized protein n=2 Tax=Fusarium oxysporum species complex TaxID=171631 RepID=X0KHE6_FUSO5|nr:uncharacterized protein FOIG_02936 [Fusarium odoratissimum NRRL 54006]EXM08111.1 hypothetical protein FOIG_02936 [Fusarium odoratissimum NRRL 54006]TXC10017.1 hypothetical protein FocTR4_00005025 [Fusarium oxysporum f. sp. cubense]
MSRRRAQKIRCVYLSPTTLVHFLSPPTQLVSLACGVARFPLRTSDLCFCFSCPCAQRISRYLHPLSPVRIPSHKVAQSDAKKVAQSHDATVSRLGSLELSI